MNSTHLFCTGSPAEEHSISNSASTSTGTLYKSGCVIKRRCITVLIDFHLCKYNEMWLLLHPCQIIFVSSLLNDLNTFVSEAIDTEFETAIS